MHSIAVNFALVALLLTVAASKQSSATTTPMNVSDSAPTIAVVDLDKERFAYRAEGNANLVLSLCDRRMVLRMLKSPQGTDNKLTTTTSAASAKEATTLRRNVNYMGAISSLLADEFAVVPRIVRVHCDDWATCNRLMDRQRPAHRLDKYVWNCTAAVLYPDVARLPDALRLDTWLPTPQPTTNDEHQPAGPGKHALAASATTTTDESKSDQLQQANETWTTYAVEIKPKQGWWQRTAADNAVVATMCPFCSLQYLKCLYSVVQFVGLFFSISFILFCIPQQLQQGKIRDRSEYCPLDLFSGCRRRARRAVAALIEHPENNLRLFADDMLLYGGDDTDGVNVEQQAGTLDWHFERLFGNVASESNRNTFVDLMVQALYSEFNAFGLPPEKPTQQDETHRPAGTPIGCEPTPVPSALPANCVLGSVLRVQKLLEATWQHPDVVDALDADADANDRRIDGIVGRMRRGTADEALRLHVDDLSAAERYLLGATALDCSLMVTFRRVRLSSEADVVRLTDGQRSHLIWPTTNEFGSPAFVVQVTVIDLDPKQLVAHRRKYGRQLAESHQAASDQCA